MANLLILIPNRRDLPFHHKLRAVATIINGLAVKQLTVGDILVQAFEDLRIGMGTLQK
jgi:hypothetical protein